MEHKTFPAFNVKVDEPQGIVEHIIAVMGNIDMGGDVIHPGAFTKTLNERGGKIRVLDQHQTDSVLRTLGKPLTIQEVGRAELPLEVVQRFPEATGGVKAITQYNLKTQAGHDAFQHILVGDVNEYSIGYDAIQGGTDYAKILASDGTEQTVRNLREVKLWEYSPVLWGMNPATATMSAKTVPAEGKPWDVFKEGDKWRVYKVDADGEPTGDSLGEHDSEEEARAQVRALYASEGKEDAPPVEATIAPQEIKIGRAIAKRNAARISQIRTILAELEKEAGLLAEEEEDEEEDGAPDKAAPDDSQARGAGPAETPPTTMEIMALELELSQHIVEG